LCHERFDRMALHSDSSRFTPLGNTFLPLGEFSYEKAARYRRHTRAHSYAGYVPHRLHWARVPENKLQDDPDETSCFSNHSELLLAHEDEDMQRQVEEISKNAALAETFTSKGVDSKAPGNSQTHSSKKPSITDTWNAHQLEELEECEELGLQRGGQTMADGNDACDHAMQKFTETASVVSEDVDQPHCPTSLTQQQSCFLTRLPLQDHNQSTDQVQSSSPSRNCLVLLSDLLDAGGHRNPKFKWQASQEFNHQNADHMFCLQGECPVTPSSNCGKSLDKDAPSAEIADAATTLMIRNLPRDISQCQLLDEVNSSGFVGTYDFCYMPCDFKLGKGQGFAFINLISPDIAETFKRIWHRSFRFGINPGCPGLNVSLAAVQGKEANVSKWSSSRLRRIRNPRLWPFVQDNPAVLPMPSNQSDSDVRTDLPTPISIARGVKREVKIANSIEQSDRLGHPVLLHKLLP